ncbi:MAG TPA: methyl-accepting chemotaxis protein [Candidatus Competibacteraceae bacterium]|nr:HAMP domain-containing protein [Candidatus Competibacteraceae bacterium]MCP5132650.1 HAMP domain-containing protein [Gammaproteobacteria bacterium]HPF58530.1 methyl-accepting chemotaxis protein [Candidatus Competibacteraceae bacterium]HRY18762.1 methyl-accepting chemotaxis protein [Candidatus Competibacteraceae bacterium]
MGGQKINARLTFTIIVQLVILVGIGLTAYFGMNRIGNTLVEVNQSVDTQADLGRLSELLRTDLLSVVNSVARGTSNWEQGNAALPLAKAKFEENWEELLSTLSTNEQERLQNTYKSSLASINETFAELEGLFAGRDRAQLNLFVNNDLEALVNPFFETLLTNTAEIEDLSAQNLKTAQSTSNTFTVLIVVIGLIGIIASFGLGSTTYRAITNPLNKMMEAVQQVGQGNYTARTGLTGSDELSELGQAFDQVLNERVNALVEAEHENEQLNDSIISLLQAVSQLSQRDLTVKVPVTEDVTGPVADALNLLTNETATVLQGVTHISEQVATASDKVKAQSDAVIAVAENERHAVEQTTADLAAASETMKQIAQLAQECNAAAETTIKTTQAALQTVTNTVSGINNTRDTIRETEKRIKRLGERSQEISGVVNLINTIAERTHILALNASMHAASAGEAGRGFAVVADEVQRLAENAREATSQIATLVSNIQIETADTVNAMNAAISQVVDGSRLAEQAGEQMQRTQETTTELVVTVRQIASRSQDQARVSSELVNRAEQIQASTQETSQQLLEQTVQTTNLVEYARNLLNSVRLFRLPT